MTVPACIIISSSVRLPCQGYISKEEYRSQVDQALDFLNGNMKGVLKDLEAKMLEASEELRFEDAKDYRDLIEHVRRIESGRKSPGAAEKIRM